MNAYLRANKLIRDIHKRRLDLQMTQEELSKLSGVSPKAISNIENLVRYPTLDVLFKLVDALNMKISVKTCSDPATFRKKGPMTWF